jgi:hypothetical protein
VACATETRFAQPRDDIAGGNRLSWNKLSAISKQLRQSNYVKATASEQFKRLVVEANVERDVLAFACATQR